MKKLVNQIVCNHPVASDGLQQEISTNMHPIIVDMERNYWYICRRNFNVLYSLSDRHYSMFESCIYKTLGERE